MSTKKMIISDRNMPIGFFDSGIGGITVLAEAIRLMPEESFIYYADSQNAPYGEKEKASIYRLAVAAVENLLVFGVKAIVIACNTATSAAIRDLRQKYSIPLIGMEPALKPAIENNPAGNILVMATPLTLQEEKFRMLAAQYDDNDNIEILPCPGLAQAIEENGGDYTAAAPVLKSILANTSKAGYQTIVLGCTHYVFIKEEIRTACAATLTVDGNYGTVRHLNNTLKNLDLLTDRSSPSKQSPHFLSSAGETGVELCQHMLNMYTAGQG